MFKHLVILAVFVLCGATAYGTEVIKEEWDWSRPMAAVSKKYTGTPGKVVPLGDSITYANQAGSWARSGKGKTAAEQVICKWMNADRNDKNNGWWLAADDQPNGRSWTAASGIRSEQYLAGGFHGLPSLDEILKTHNPLIALILLGTNDLNAQVPTEKFLANMEILYKKCLNNGTIPVVQTIAPTTWDKGGKLEDYNKGLVELASKLKLPLIDVNGEFLVRQPGDAWKGTLVSKDGAHFTHTLAAGPATEENLKNCGYLLRCWLSVHKVMEIKAKVLDVTPSVAAVKKPDTLADASSTAPVSTNQTPLDAAHQYTDSLAVGLLRSDFESVKRLLATDISNMPANGQQLREEATRVIQMQTIILDSLRGDVNKEIMIDLKNGLEKVKIEDVKPLKIKSARVLRNSAGVAFGAMDRSFTYADLTVNERLRRLGDAKTPDREVMRGLLCYEAKAWDRARQSFTQAGSPLGTMLISHLDEKQSERESNEQAQQKTNAESAASRAYRSILLSSEVSEQNTDIDTLILKIRKKNFSAQQVLKVKREMESFSAKHADTDVARTSTRLLNVLAVIRPNMPLYVEQSVIDAALTKLKASHPMGVTPNVTIVDAGIMMSFCDQKNLLDISALAGLPIVSLNICGTQVRDLTPLRGMPFSSFTYDGFAKDLSWMEGMPITNICLMKADWLCDLTPLRGMRLVSLSIFSEGRNNVSDLSPLKGMALSELAVTCNWQNDQRFRGSLRDIAPLVGMKLKKLNLSNACVSDLVPLKNMPLESLIISCTDVRDLTPLRGMPLKFLDIRKTQTTDMSPLSDIPTLKKVQR